MNPPHCRHVRPAPRPQHFLLHFSFSSLFPPPISSFPPQSLQRRPLFLHFFVHASVPTKRSVRPVVGAYAISRFRRRIGSLSSSHWRRRSSSTTTALNRSLPGDAGSSAANFIMGSPAPPRFSRWELYGIYRQTDTNMATPAPSHLSFPLSIHFLLFARARARSPCLHLYCG